MASLIRGVQDLVVEDREVQSKTEADWVGWCEVGLGNLRGSLVGLEGLIGRLLTLVSNGKLSKIAVIVTLPGENMSAVDFEISLDALTSCSRRPWTLHSGRME